MATLTVWKFDSPTGAQEAANTLERLSKQGLITVHDAAVVEWEEGKKKPKTRQLQNMTAVGALSGAFWGMLFGLLFFIPFLGAAIGAAAGALGGAFSDVGIDDDFINAVKQNIVPGTSALFVLSSDAVIDKVHNAFEGVNAELVKTNLSDEQEAKLREAFAED